MFAIGIHQLLRALIAVLKILLLQSLSMVALKSVTTFTFVKLPALQCHLIHEVNLKIIFRLSIWLPQKKVF